MIDNDAAITELETQKKAKLMTLDEAINARKVWIECINDEDECGFASCRLSLEQFTNKVLIEVFTYENRYPKIKHYNPDDYLQNWRCWSSIPTEEQRIIKPWR